MEAREVATVALVTGWTMNEVREHTLRDLDAMARAVKLQERRRKAAMRRGR